MIKISWTMRQTDKTRLQIYPNGCGQCSNKSVKGNLRNLESRIFSKSTSSGNEDDIFLLLFH